MKVLLLTLPHTNPVGPTLGIAVLSAHLKKVFDDIEVKAIDLGLDSIYWLLSKKQIQKAIDRLNIYLDNYNKKDVLNYEEYSNYTKYAKAICVLNELGKEITNSINVLQDKLLFEDDQMRENANFVINSVLECMGYAWEHTHINAGDYRTKFSPFSINDIEEYVNNPEYCIYNDFFDTWLNENDLSDIEIIGISISFAKQMLPSLLFAKKVKAKYPNLIIQLGGSLLAHLNKDTFKPLFKWCDCIVQREGEHALENLVRMVRDGGKFNPNIGVLYLNSKEEVVECKNRTKVLLDESNAPDFSGFQLDNYLIPTATIPMQIGRSCYWGKCSFCCLNAAFDYNSGYKCVKKIVDDIEHLVETMGIENIEFVDDAIPPQYANLLSLEMIQRNLDIKWFCYARLDEQFNDEIFRNMKSAGCVGLKFGLESASPKVLELMNKGIDIENAKKLIEGASNSGIIPQVAFFFGFPGEQENDIQKTVDFIENNVVNKGIIAYNGMFRLLNSMPLLLNKQKYGIKSVVKWNVEEELIDYYLVEMETSINCIAYIKKAEEYLQNIIEKDLTRSVDLRRYWFSGYSQSKKRQNVAKELQKKLVYTTKFPLNEVEIFQDIKNGDFLPGEGIYRCKSYISEGLHGNKTLDVLNRLKTLSKKENSGDYLYDIENRRFVVQ